MLFFYSPHPLVLDNLLLLLASYDVKEFKKPDAFLEDLNDARMVLIEDDLDLVKRAQEKSPSKPILLMAREMPQDDEDVYFLKKPFTVAALCKKIDFILSVLQKGLILAFDTPLFRFDGAMKTLTTKKTGTEIRLTQKEAEIIQYLYEHADRLVTRDELLSDIFGYREGVETHTLETHIYKLRQKMLDDGDELLITQDGGYRLKVDH